MAAKATSHTATQAAARAASLAPVMPVSKVPAAPQTSSSPSASQHMCAASGVSRTLNRRRRYTTVVPNMKTGAASIASPAPASAIRGIAIAAMMAMRTWAVTFWTTWKRTRLSARISAWYDPDSMLMTSAATNNATKGAAVTNRGE